jgi:hypothetical protein
MKIFKRVVSVGALVALAACGSSSGSSAETDPPSTAPATEAPATDPPATAPAATDPPATDPPATAPAATDPPATDPPATDPPATEPLGPVIVLGAPGADGVIPVVIDGARLDPLFDQFQDGADPLYLIHTQQEDVFVGVELYTVFGSGWTGELGTFPTDCTTHGICIYLDPDGLGPLPGGGPGEGTITITELEGARIVTLDDIEITADDGQVYSLTGVTLTG